ncbi:hypothetical protein TNCT_682601 [Trichonephila clavata]|uniref:Uncharacterized protein n=1 Tax=Trichonephila clavata TaxID=2740835 RepID=A0A8X6GYE2_TRICU|nr:hypothetical protein TNCT_682601 [Trichonephila clavata]
MTPLPTKCASLLKISVIQTCDSKETTSPIKPCLLLPDKGEYFTDDQHRKLYTPISQYETCFIPGEEPTPHMEHWIDNGVVSPVTATLSY